MGRNDDAATPARAPRRRVVAAVATTTVLGVALALTLPVALDSRRSGAAEGLHADLQRVATAQASWHADHGSYSTSLQDLRVPQGRHDVAIVSAGPEEFCAGAYDDGTRTALFYSPGTSFTDHPCT